MSRLRTDTSLLTPQQRRYERMWGNGEDLRARAQDSEARSRDLEDVLRKRKSQRYRLLWRVAIQTVRANGLRAKVSRQPRLEQADARLKAAHRAASEMGALVDAERRAWEAQAAQFEKERRALRDLLALEQDNLERESLSFQQQKDHLEREHQTLTRKMFELERASQRASHLDVGPARQHGSECDGAGRRTLVLEGASRVDPSTSAGTQQAEPFESEGGDMRGLVSDAISSAVSLCTSLPELKAPLRMMDQWSQLERIRACARQVEIRIVDWECSKLDLDRLSQCDKEEMMYFGQCALELARLLQVRMSEQVPMVRPQSWWASFGFCCARRQDGQQLALAPTFGESRV